MIQANTPNGSDTPKSSDQSDSEILRLARRVSAESKHLEYGSPFDASEDSTLDPNSEKFDAKVWAKRFYETLYATDPARVMGVSYENLHVFGYGSDTDFQNTVGNWPFKLPELAHRILGGRGQKVDILRDFAGLITPGEMVCVLGPPGSGCSTLLKTIAGETHGLNIGKESRLNYNGILPETVRSMFRGEAVYTAEVDVHYPMLSVDTTLYFAALARTPYSLPSGISREQYAAHMRDVVMSQLGISHIRSTKVGNDFVRGVSGGERKRVTIAEATLSGAPLQCWDNSTRGLDSANAIEFCRTLRTQANVFGVASLVAIYQAPQQAYDMFDSVCVLYEGRQIYFGPAERAQGYFERLGFVCPEGQSTPDFLTSMSSSSQRTASPGFEGRVPRTPDDFVKAWVNSVERKELLGRIADYNAVHPPMAESYQKFAEQRRLEKSRKQRVRSPYNMSLWRQIQLCLWRDWQRLKADPSVPIVMLAMNLTEALLVASIFFGLEETTSSFYARGAAIFVLILLNAFGSLLEIIGLYAKRNIVEKHKRYALYHPSTEAIASMIMDMPYKLVNCLCTVILYYFMVNLRQDAGRFFFFLLNSFFVALSMSMFFRLFASLTKTLEQALAPASVILIAMVLYAGFAIPTQYMRGWASWIRYLNPAFYGFESAMLNEFVGRQFACDQIVPVGPAYVGAPNNATTCAVKGARPGENFVDGAEYVRVAFGYVNSHKWRNFGILVAFTIGLCAAHLLVSEVVAAARSKGEVLVFKRGGLKKQQHRKAGPDEEHQAAPCQLNNLEHEKAEVEANVAKQTSILHWQNVSYTVKSGGEERLILDQVDGWVKPGTLTALMGVSGAGKTTLLDVLASRVTMGVVSGDMLVDAAPRDESFQRKTGYVQQQDLHLPTATVRETLAFSALLRQPARYSKQEKLAYVDEVISMLDMQSYRDAVVGIPGEGLNVEQRKRLTIGVELVARPALLLFLDEPTSGLDSQTSWSIVNLLTKLSKSGQAVLCTIHQPSAILFQRFDRLLLLAKGGRTVYFGNIGANSKTLIDYFVRQGGSPPPAGANPAEWMLETIGAAPGVKSVVDWPSVWRSSDEYKGVQAELQRLEQSPRSGENEADKSDYAEFAAPFFDQLRYATTRTFQQYWRSPAYINSKALLTIGSSLIIGFSFFMANNTQQGLQNQMFGVLVFLFVVITLILQVIPMFVIQRELYESRERKCRTYHWAAFVLSNVVAEIVWNTGVAVLCFLVWYYPVGLLRNARWTGTVSSRSTLVFLNIWSAFLFGSTLAHALIAGAPTAEAASALGNVLGICMYAFAGVLVQPGDLPRFWIFMYRVNPFTYLVSSFLSAAIGEAPVQCAANELLAMEAPGSQTCEQYLSEYISTAGGYVVDSAATGVCQYCPVKDTTSFLESVSIDFADRWRDFGLLWVYICVNIAGACALYWLCRMPKRKTKA